VGYKGIRRGGLSLLLAGVLCGVVTLFALMLASAPAQAYESYQHGGIDDCETCHMNAHTWWVPTNEHCLTCHTGYQIVRSSRLCWDCHIPGQDLGWARTDAGCTSTCHLRGGATFAHTAHTDRSTACTTCHAVSKSASEPAGSAHHVIPAPRLDAVAPTAAPPGSAVTLSGQRFTWAAIVRFGGVNAAFAIISDRQITALVPVAAVSGPVTVLSAGGVAASVADFVVLRPVAPTLTLSASPSSVLSGRPIRFLGRLTPAVVGGSQVTIVVQRRQSGVWKAAASSLRATDASGAIGWSYRPRRAGTYHARAAFAGPPAAASPWVAFRVR
jgi:hypothetical protein